ncbi:MAG: hypothetical protein Q7S33_01780 [Nanoarchaeota archaeon]|nr:hypothetical protein [Nanoarchaeota archaeon]
MIVKFLGTIDILTAISFWLFISYNLIPQAFIVFFAVILLIKGVSFLILKDIASLLDVISSLVILASLNFSIPMLLSTLVIFYLIQKGVFSLL